MDPFKTKKNNKSTSFQMKRENKTSIHCKRGEEKNRRFSD